MYKDSKGQSHNKRMFLRKQSRTLQLKKFFFWCKQITFRQSISRKKNCTHCNWIDFRKAMSLFSSLGVKHTIISIQIISISTWSQIVFDVWGEQKGHWGLCMMHWMEINASLFCQLLLAISPAICCLLQKEGLLFLSFS